MNRLVSRVMMVVAVLAALGMTATLAGAQTDAVPEAVVPKEKPRLYRYESSWAFPPAHWADVDKDNATGNQKVLDRPLVNSTESAGEFDFVFVAPNAEARDRFVETYNAALYKNEMLAPAKAAILFDETPHDDWVRVDATYK
jgi:hypothetical protein